MTVAPAANRARVEAQAEDLGAVEPAARPGALDVRKRERGAEP